MYYVILGGVGSGKGTRAKLLCEALSIPHITTGGLVREIAKTNEELKRTLDSGTLLTDEYITELLTVRLGEADCELGFVLDGYPRTLRQAYLLDQILSIQGKVLSKVVRLIVSEETILERTLHRQECPKCNTIYGTAFHPKEAGICDKCGSQIIHRSDDTEETIKKRIKIYNDEIQPISAYYEAQNMLFDIDASNNPELILSLV